MTLDQVIAENPGIGRRKLMQKTGCTGYAAETALKRARGDTPAGLKKERISGGLPECEGLKGFAGLEGFAALHAPESRQRRHDAAIKAQIEKFIAGPLKRRGWYYDQEAAREAGVGSQDWARNRDAYTHLIVSVRADAGSRNEKLCWCHPDCVEAMRAIAEGRSV